MNKYIKTFIFIVILAVIVAGGIILLKKRKEQVANLPKPEKPVYTVKGATIKIGTLQERREFLGKVVPEKTVNVSTKYPGYIEKIYVTENKKVKKGDIIVSIDPQPVLKEIKNLYLTIETLKSQLEALLSQKEALKTAYKTAQNVYLRNKKLYEKKAIPKEALEQSYSNYKKAEAQYKQTLAGIKEIQSKIKQTQNQIQIKQNQLSYLEIKAPINGTIAKVFLKEGNIAFSGKPILQMFTDNLYKVLIQFPQKTPIKEGTKVILKYGKKELTLHISKIYPSAEKNNLLTAEVLIKNPPSEIKPNSLINVQVVLKEETGFLVPNTSILHLTRGDYLLVYENGMFKKVPVEVSAQNENYSIVKGNLKEGMIIATGDESKLQLLSTIKKGKVIK